MRGLVTVTAQTESDPQALADKLPDRIGGSFEQEWREGGLWTWLTLALGEDGARLTPIKVGRTSERTER